MLLKQRLPNGLKVFPNGVILLLNCGFSDKIFYKINIKRDLNGTDM